MEHTRWYGGQAHPYHLQEPLAAAAPLHNAAPPPQPTAHYQRRPSEPFFPFSPSSSVPSAAAAATSAQYPYHPHSQPPNPSSIPSGHNEPAPASYQIYEPPPGSGAMQPPEVDAYGPKPYGAYIGYNGHSAAHYGYPPVGVAPYYHGVAGGDARAFSVKDAIRQYGVDPAAYDNVLRPPPVFSMHQNKPTSYYGTARRKNKKAAKGVQSAYCKVCKVDCNSQEVLVNHRQGKKHKKNLEKLKESIVPKPAKAPTTTAENKETPEAEKDKTATVQTKKKSAPATELDLETKKRRLLEEGATTDAMRVCSICNIVCNSEVVFNYHISGQKHAAMVKKQEASTS